MAKSRPPFVPTETPKNYIREWRTFRGLSQRGLQKLTNISYVQIGKYERGETPPSTDMLARIAQALRVDIPTLMARDPQQDEGFWEAWGQLSTDDRQKVVEYTMMVASLAALARGK
jgi:transcriptional regulator with XRE-family HTH domain